MWKLIEINLNNCAVGKSWGSVKEGFWNTSFEFPTAEVHFKGNLPIFTYHLFEKFKRKYVDTFPGISSIWIILNIFLKLFEVSLKIYILLAPPLTIEFNTDIFSICVIVRQFVYDSFKHIFLIEQLIFMR